MAPPPDPSPYHTAEKVYFEVKRDSGSLPPPYHYSTKIVIMPDGAGLYEMTPDYEFNNPPHWHMNFHLSAEQMSDLVHLFQPLQIRAESSDPSWKKSSGGENVSVRYEVRHHAGEINITLDQENKSDGSAFIRALHELVPENIRNDLQQRRDQYIADYLAGNRK